MRRPSGNSFALNFASVSKPNVPAPDRSGTRPRFDKGLDASGAGVRTALELRGSASSMDHGLPCWSVTRKSGDAAALGELDWRLELGFETRRTVAAAGSELPDCSAAAAPGSSSTSMTAQTAAPMNRQPIAFLGIISSLSSADNTATWVPLLLNPDAFPMRRHFFGDPRYIWSGLNRCRQRLDHDSMSILRMKCGRRLDTIRPFFPSRNDLPRLRPR